MKKYYIFFLLLTTNVAMAQKAESLTIKGDVSKVKEPIEEVVFFYYNTEHSNDSCLVKNGKFIFKTDASDPGVIMLQFRTKKGITPPNDEMVKFIYRLYVQPGLISITSSGKANNFIVTGAKWNGDFYKYMDEAEKNYNLWTARNDEAKKYMEAKDTAKAKMLQAGSMQYFDSLRAKSGSEFALAHPNSPVAFMALNAVGGNPFNAERVMPVFTQLPVSVQQSKEGRQLKEKIDKTLKLGIGKTAPDFTQPDAEGINISLSSYRGKYVLLDFWANWCVFCRQETPYMKKAFEKYNDKGFTIISVSVDKEADKEKWIKAIHTDGVNRWAQVADLKGKENAAAILYSVEALPANFLIDPQGKIIATNLRGDDLERKLEELLK